MSEASSEAGGASDLANVLERNGRALLDRRRAKDGRKAWQQRIAETITRFTGSVGGAFGEAA